MRILVIIIAVLALFGGLAHLLGGVLGFFSGVLMLTTDFTPEIAQASEMSPPMIGLIFLLIAVLMLVNGAIFVTFAVGALTRRRRARFLGIFGYALNILVFLLTVAVNPPQSSLLPYIFGTFVAVAFIVILWFAKSAFEKAPGNQPV